MRNTEPATKQMVSGSSFPIKRAVIEFWRVFFSSNLSHKALTYSVVRFRAVTQKRLNPKVHAAAENADEGWRLRVATPRAARRS
jgi:hypothetical protein